MDHSSIPACALYRNRGTVILRLKMDVTGCGNVTSRPLHQRTSGCEQCNRTRLISKYSDCVNGVVEKCRPYRSSAARSRYVNVCAAICLLLLFGGLSPRSSAAPDRRAMEGENKLWANPCDYNDSNSKTVYPPNYDKEVALKLVAQAKSAYTTAAKYKDAFASKLHSYSSFDELLHSWETYDWLREFDWMPEEGFPKQKILYQTMPDEYMNKFMTQFDYVLPGMYKGLKMIVAGLYAFSNEGLNAEIISEASMKESINQTMHAVRAVLCYFSDIMKARNLMILPLPDPEVPVFTPDDALNKGLFLYRDTLNYLEYIEQVFQKFYETS